MNDSLGRIHPQRRTGNERLHSRGYSVHDKATLLNFWEWYGSDILNNTERGIFAEYIVAFAINGVTVMSDAREGWDSYDLISPDGVKIEVKSSGYKQSWKQEKESIPTFDIARKLVWDAETDTFSDDQVRSADVYVFCLYNPRAAYAPNMLDPLDVSQWDFFVLPTYVLEKNAPEQKSIGISGLNRLGARKVPFDQIRSTICEMISLSDRTTVT
ncbi:MAG: hypothetical protein F4X57_00885 [Chloroflexi bacterium]|nr:hypothetical protein [Chloroflexota bacterium]